METPKTISSVAELIDAMGGPAPFAEAVGERVGTVTQWKSRNRLPARKHPMHSTIFAQRNLDVAPSLWNLVTSGGAAQ